MSGTIQASVIKDSASATNNLTLDTGGNATVGNTLVMGSSFLRNRIINGDMRVNQRGYTSAAPLTSNSSYGVDRFNVSTTVAGGFSAYQSATAPTGFTNSLFYTKTTGTAPSAGDVAYILQYIEGYNISDFAWGTANAKSVTLSFWVYAGATGTFSGSLRNGAATFYAYPFTYTISSANTWTQITVTIPGPTVGTWATDSTIGISVFFNLGSGSSFLGAAGSWTAGNFCGATGATTYPASTTGGTFYLTGVQLEVGTVATPFERQIYSNQLAQCQRYYQQITGATGSGYSPVGTGVVNSATTAFVIIPFATTMRQAPTYAYTGSFSINPATTSIFLTSITTQYTGTGATGMILITGSAGGMTVGTGLVLYSVNAATNAFSMSSEL